MTSSELALLEKLRGARNHIAHGREVDQPPTREQINYGIAIVARMLVHRIAALSGRPRVLLGASS